MNPAYATDRDHARRVAFLLGLDVSAATPVHVASPTRSNDRASAWAAAASDVGPHGLLLAPLDVLPGDHLLAAVREQVGLHVARHGGSPRDALTEILALALNFPASHHTPWRAWIELVQQGIVTQAPWVDRLTPPDLAAGTLTELAAEAADVGLSWVCDARLANTSCALLPRVARAFADDDRERTGVALRSEQLADLVRNQYRRVGLFVRGPLPSVASVDLDRVRMLAWQAATPSWSAWALEDLDARALAALSAAGAPAAAAPVVDALRDGALKIHALSVALSTDEDAVVAGVVAAWALGFAEPQGPLA